MDLKFQILFVAEVVSYGTLSQLLNHRKRSRYFCIGDGGSQKCLPNNQDAVRPKMTVPQSEVFTSIMIHVDQLTIITNIARILFKWKRKYKTKSWEKRVTASLFMMHYMDTWQMYKGYTLANESHLPQTKSTIVLPSVGKGTDSYVISTDFLER